MVSGDLDIRTSPRLRQTLTDLLEPATTGTPDPAGVGQRLRGVILDLREVAFMDSSALGVLVHGYKLTRLHQQGYAVVATSSLITKMFEVTGLARSMPLHPDVAAAVAALGRPASA
ncbi:hypothetical protein GCM10027586_19220 [Kineococcus gypseus]|uniref:anti-sigma factor antagonist n=1 Tax=Kineococcus gypseus TaxID=1637102 RepID=UPI003D7E886D